MKNIDSWRPSKYVYYNEKLRASRDAAEVGAASRLITDLVAQCYDTHLGHYAKGRLVDLGCGKTPLYHAYQPFISSCTCVDWANTFHETSHLDVACDLNGDLPLESDAFDTIILSDVLEHIAQPEKLWSEMSRILCPGGRAIINVPFMYWLHETPFDYYRYTEFALRRFAEMNGFKVVKLVPVGGAPAVLADITAKTVVNWPGVGRLIVSAIHGWYNFFTKTAIGKRFSNKTASTFPLFYFMIVEKP
jgi:SAM-dependent methyltransferase